MMDTEDLEPFEFEIRPRLTPGQERRVMNVLHKVCRAWAQRFRLKEGKVISHWPPFYTKAEALADIKKIVEGKEK